MLATTRVTLDACATRRRTTGESTGTLDTPVIPVNASTLPAGVTLEARLDQTLGTQQSKRAARPLAPARSVRT